MPAVLLILEIIATTFLIVNDYEIPSLLFFFFVLIGLFLLYRLFRQIATVRAVKQARAALSEAEKFVHAKMPMEAIKKWKSILLRLPKEQYLSTLLKIEKIYKAENMIAAVEKVKAILNESQNFFMTTQNLKQISKQSFREWQARVIKLREMISDLPVNKEQDSSEG
jgi:hypothetical protein